VIDGVDITGLTLATNVCIPDNVLKGKWRAQIYIDERASHGQEAALISVFTGEQGGPVSVSSPTSPVGPSSLGRVNFIG
jgi:hypothetical protein